MQLFDEMPYLEGERLILREFEASDAPALNAFSHNEGIYKFLPTFLYEQKYDEAAVAIEHMRAECFDTRESLLLAVCLKETPNDMIGIAEAYNLGDEGHKVSIGVRLSPEYWSQGISTEVTEMLKDYLLNDMGLSIITTHVMVENIGSARAMAKSGFKKTESGVPEDWGRGEPVLVDKYVYIKES